ncbi:hypothetical protein D6K36_11025 [Salmonella enterica subsp. enterica]|nr:hypothetical protein [Salmonella enterica subsp. enterica]
MNAKSFGLRSLRDTKGGWLREISIVLGKKVRDRAAVARDSRNGCLVDKHNLRAATTHWHSYAANWHILPRRIRLYMRYAIIWRRIQ